MPSLFIPLVGAMGAGVAVFLAVRLWFVRGRRYLPALRLVWRERAWLNRVPVGPLSKLTTRTEAVTSLARRADLEVSFAPSLVWRYKELSLWASGIITLWLAYTAPLDQALLVGVLLIGLSCRWPELYLARRAVQRQRELERGLTHVIDLLRLYVSAGKNLEDAMRSVAAVAGGLWGRVLARVVYRLDAGLLFEEALEGVGFGLELPDFNRFMLALKQARLLGASLGGTLSVQAQLLRARRRGQAETQARTAAVKIALPLVLCIFPALLIIYLAPAVLRVLESL